MLIGAKHTIKQHFGVSDMRNGTESGHSFTIRVNNNNNIL